jgi:peptide subunit release factor 1 (eRF1)
LFKKNLHEKYKFGKNHSFLPILYIPPATKLKTLLKQTQALLNQQKPLKQLLTRV